MNWIAAFSWLSLGALIGVTVTGWLALIRAETVPMCLLVAQAVSDEDDPLADLRPNWRRAPVGTRGWFVVGVADGPSRPARIVPCGCRIVLPATVA